MNDAALSKPGAYAQIRIREPSGERTFGAALSIGGEGADVVVPGVGAGIALTIERRAADWFAVPAPGAAVRFDGRPLTRARELHRNDVFAVGDAQLVVADVSRTRVRLDLHHLVGNATIAPVAMVAPADIDAGDEDLEIRVARPDGQPPVIPAVRTQRHGPALPGAVRRPVPKQWLVAGAVVLAMLLAAVVLVSMLQPVSLDVQPADARVGTPGTFVSFRAGNALYLLSGTHIVRAEREGYVPAQASAVVSGNGAATVRLRLAKLPGKLHIDTGGIAASVIIDGVESGRAPGDVEVPPGHRTITLRAERYLDYVTNVEIEGASVRQDLKAVLQTSWGTLKVSAIPAGARLTLDGREIGVAPAAVALPSGVRHVQIAAPRLKTWESSVVIRAGETLAIGPITLGQPDAHLTLRSEPVGVEVTVAGTYRGRTPLAVDLPAGIAHEVVASLPGYASWTKAVFAEPGRAIAVEARLQPILARVTIRGEPADAELLVDGAPRGNTPQSLDLITIEHRIEVRKAGFLPFTDTVTPATGLERSIHYHLTSADRGTALLESAPTVSTQSGYVLRLVPPGTFRMGSDRREQGRRPNEGLRQVTLQRPYYIGVTELTNLEFEQKSLDLDAQPVATVSWDEAAEYCNWLSEHEGLTPAYEKRDGKYFLKHPVTVGYRLPTEAEWEYAARYAGPGQTRRFAWGDSLPVEPEVGNIAGAEAKTLLNVALEGYRDDYPAVAPVGKFKPSPLGLHDMAGNVSEWVNDYYLSFVDSAPATDPVGPEKATHHVVRGANWKSATVAELRLAWRDSGDEGSETIGFRLARYAE
jgi:formylglycine-generating enzyme required for sulfatase activity